MGTCSICGHEIHVATAYEHMLQFHPELEDEINDAVEDFLGRLKEWV